NILFCWSNMARLRCRRFRILEVGSPSRCNLPCIRCKSSDPKCCCSTSRNNRWYWSMVSCTLEIMDEKSKILLKYRPVITFPSTYQKTARPQGTMSKAAAKISKIEIPVKVGATYRTHEGTKGRCSLNQRATL